MKFKILFTILHLVLSGSVCAESIFVDPGIPHGETITYASRIGEKLIAVSETVLIKNEGGKQLYSIESRSESLDRNLLLEKETMAIESVHTVRKFDEVILDSKLTVRDEKPPSGKGEVKLADFAVLTYIFRGFPFEKMEKVKIGFYGEQRERKFNFSAKYKGKEEIKLNKKTIDCYKLEFGMDGFWGRLIPKMKTWYSVEPPHYLVRYQGLVGPPGSPKREVELMSYKIVK